MHSIKQIIDNQEKFKNEIISFLNSETTCAKKVLNSIKSDDKFILKEKNKLKSKFKKINQKKYIDSLFFLNYSRNLTFYVWWEENENETKILKYDKR
jgi:hypothetical protein